MFVRWYSQLHEAYVYYFVSDFLCKFVSVTVVITNFVLPLPLNNPGYIGQKEMIII